MEQHITQTIEAMMHSHCELARILEAERVVTAHISGITAALPGRSPEFGQGVEALELMLESHQTIAAYLNSLGDLEEAIAENVSVIMAELQAAEGAE